MKRTILCLCLLGMLTVIGCGHKVDKESLISSIKQSEQSLELDITDPAGLDSNGNGLIALYRQYYTQFPQDSLAPVYMQRAADINISLGNPGDAIAILDSIITLHPDYDDVAGCWFLKGYAFETAENYDSARVAYTYFIDNYPDHYLAEDTRRTLQYLGLSPEEMFEAIMAGASDANLVME